MDHVLLLLFTAQVTFIAAVMCLSMCLRIRPVISTSTLFYGCLASHILLLLAFYSPIYVAACLLNVLGEVIAVVIGAPQSKFPDIFYGTGYGYEDDAEAYCWYLLHWIWSDSVKVVACCVLSVLVSAIIFLTLRVWSCLFPSRRQRIQRMQEYTARIRAETRAIENHMKAEHGWTDEDFEGLRRLGGGNDEAVRARRRSFADGVMARREREQEQRRETIARVREDIARIHESEARLNEQRTAELRGQRGRLRRNQARAADWGRRLRENATGEHERRVAEAEERVARRHVATVDLQERIAAQERYEEGMRSLNRQTAAVQKEIDRLQAATTRAQPAVDATADAQDSNPASRFEATA
jgi:hypothetical protein